MTERTRNLQYLFRTGLTMQRTQFQSRYESIGVVHHGRLKSAIDFSIKLEQFLKASGIKVWRVAATKEAEIVDRVREANLVLAVGGDGTLLRAVRSACGQGIPIIGINLGRLGFMTELTASDTFEKLPLLLAGGGWNDVRATLSARVSGNETSYTALNDVVVGRKMPLCMLRARVRIDGQLLTEYHADGIITATATGSTGYALAAGGPILNPQSRDILLQPICPHLSFTRCLVLPPVSVIELHLVTEEQAVLSIDGQIATPLETNATVEVRISEKVVNFLRLNPPGQFYASLTQRLKGEPLCL
ncbi:MAG: NAD(+)/NADH kinase [Chloroflexi bacterium]|nr:NAD(+)/NADH kinase [Chloroflexota bacterium]